MNYTIAPNVGYSEKFVTVQREGFGGMKLCAVLTTVARADGSLGILARKPEPHGHSWPIVGYLPATEQWQSAIRAAIDGKIINLGAEYWT